MNEKTIRRRLAVLLVLAFTGWILALFWAAFGMTVLFGVVNRHLDPPPRPVCAAVGSGVQPALFGNLRPCGSRSSR